MTLSRSVMRVRERIVEGVLLWYDLACYIYHEPRLVEFTCHDMEPGGQWSVDKSACEVRWHPLAAFPSITPETAASFSLDFLHPDQHYLRLCGFHLILGNSTHQGRLGGGGGRGNRSLD